MEELGRPNINREVASRKAPITVTEQAYARMKHLLSLRDKESLGIRVKVKQGGCSGLKYVIEYADSQLPFEEVISINNITILLDPKSIMYLIGTEMDYVEEKFKSGFIFKNPNQKAQCGCGESFTV